MVRLLPTGQSAIRAVEELAALFDQHQVGGQGAVPVDEEVITAFEEIIGRFNTVYSQAHTMRVYIQSFVHTNSRDEVAQSKMSAFQPSLGQLSLLRTRLDAWLASFDLEQLLQRSAVARDHSFMLRKAHERAAHQMSSAEERPASKMSQIGSKAWTALWNRLTSQLTVKISHNIFSRLRHEVACIAVVAGNRAQPDVLPSESYQSMRHW